MSEEFMAARQRARRAFTSLTTVDDASIDLAQAALLIAAEEYPELDALSYLSRLEELAARVRVCLEEETFSPTNLPVPTNPAFHTLHALNAVLFDQEHFRGNRTHYYDPQNCFLNRVLERRLGIPLTLSLLYMEIGKRVGLQIEGIGMPFRFIVRCSAEGSSVYIDPYERGKFLSIADCRNRLKQIFKNEQDHDSMWLEPLSHKQILVRMLINLKHIYIHKKELLRALDACDRILLLNPSIPIELRDRGAINFQLKRYSRALHDLHAYLALSPHADDTQEVEQQIKLLHHLLAMMN